ncbi:hypothetical protein ATS72_014910 [Pseudoalteromonas sp. 13-15]|uniref:hypothetical protein n=1 Tax=Pseudoalteromonas TaxID=53246 RepID=UPI000731AEBE|nr:MULTISPECIES: hypothetical protein [Pseudoalteromonas]AUL74794.1 hypothetical protein ATS72_014910 [Pseudoalteromonas sp. 13-15]SIO09266.1 hypothetical protein SAMN05878071_2992 [Pseudoalteromonas marina]
MHQLLLKYKSVIKLNGWIITIATIFLFMANKSARPEYLIEFWVTFSLVHLVTISWLVAAYRFPEYRKKEIVSVLVPYISGSIIWFFLFLGLWTLLAINT